MATPRYFMWDYHTVVEVGPGCRTFAAQHFMEMGAKRVAIITDPGLVKAGILDQVKDIFEVQGQPRLAGIYDKVEQDAVMRVINDCTRWCRENAIDGILGLGGGSVLDTVKGVKCMLGMGAARIQDLMPGNFGPYIRPLGKPLGIPNISIPTTAGTGSEVSPIAVIYNEDAKVKGDLVHPFIPPDFALLDPDLTVGLPPQMTASTGFDALSHAVEGLTSPAANCMIDSLSMQSIRLVCQYLPLAVANGKDLEARTKMLVASNMGIMSFSMTGLFYPVHNIAHALGGQLRIPHGQAVGVCLPALMKFAPWHFMPKAVEMAEAFHVKTDGLDAAGMVEATREKVLSLMEECHFKTYFDQTLDQKGMETMFRAVKSDPSGLAYPLPDDVITNCLTAVFSKA